MTKPIAEYIGDIDSVNGCEIGAARDALEHYIQLLQDGEKDAILVCILAALKQGTETVELLCSEAKQYCCAPEEPAA